MNDICFAAVFVTIYTIQIDNLCARHAKLCYTPDIFRYIFWHIFIKNIDIFTIFSFRLPIQLPLQMGDEVESCQILHS